MIHLIVGNTGSGKSTYANRLREEAKGVIFTLDKWNKTLFLPDKKEDDGLAHGFLSALSGQKRLCWT